MVSQRSRTLPWIRFILSGYMVWKYSMSRLASRPRPGSAAMDLCACVDQPVTIPAGGQVVVPTGLAVAIPEGYVGIVAVRSSMGIRRGITLSNAIGVIDSDYRGPLGVGLRNTTGEDYVLQPADRMAQLMVVPVLRPEIRLVEELPETARGAGGFGSTGR